MKGNLLVVHGGGPTAVINSSLYGVIREAERNESIGSVYGALGGTAGVLAEKFIDFSTVPSAEIEMLKQTPSTAIGTSRTPLTPEDYDRMISIFKKHNIKYVLFNGGNGSMDTCGKLYRAAKDEDIRVVGIPKTIDNDIAITDHCPGYGSAARFVAQTVAEIAQDVRSMPIHVSIVETMGRNAGWITAAAALAATEYSCGPDRIYLPEIAFDEDKFLSDVQSIYDRKGYAIIVASEGLKKADHTPIVDPIFKIRRDTYFGDVGAHLAELVLKNLGIKARSEKPGIAGRASILNQSSVDREEAIQAGAAACRAALEGKTGVMIGFKRLSSDPYQMEIMDVPIEEVMLHERMMPKEFINEDGTGVTEKFTEWCRPLVGGDLLKFAWFNK
ncbi:diphosphate--fructose-6-phosphate 1-phosphotransferase [Caproiciproducens faecalis]|uniref:Pyrophosphate--fructose 6-phosphate 1-phosphotransferase n=1 Tax=Caproiciproducens faecalis TaxID=2820301 RepID=A0ABS7DMN2_9FIRM|nr:diphosphate--fructose-6-phosphate 1-phosphotransferase [Caproiciproducens faecalis]MBW7572361.1 diphosphate--fructose-6-phosphate 1-phosphotransferase [Caproiciproducens faecalis]